jgi:diguanylate cyclase (GGDEF)-like protein
MFRGSSITSLDISSSRSGQPVRPAAIEPGVVPVRAIELLVEVVQKLSLARNLEQIMAVVRTAAREFTGADGATLILREGEECYYADEDSIGPLWKGQRFPLKTCISGWVMENRTSVSIPDVYRDSRIPIELYRPTFVRSLAMVPIRSENPIGAIGNYWASLHQSTPGEIRLLQALADSTAVAIENIRIHEELEERVKRRTEELEEANRELLAEAALRKQMEAKILRLSLTDELTGLSNRRGFLLRADQTLKLVHRVHTFGWLIYIDLDGLKQVNDDHGHEAGDHLLRRAAKVLRESFRDSDIVGRIGGDEFVVFATGASTPAAEIEARLLQNTEYQNQCHGDLPPIAMSIGVIRCDPHSPNSLEDMIHQADAAMYIEKRRKRDRKREELGE